MKGTFIMDNVEKCKIWQEQILAALKPLPETEHEKIMRCAAGGIGVSASSAMRWLRGNSAPMPGLFQDRFLTHLAGVVAGYKLQLQNA